MTLWAGTNISSIKREDQLGCLHFLVWIAAVYRVPKPVYQLQVLRLLAVCQIT